jgi:hypothetical protein
MALLWLVHVDTMYGFPAYQLPAAHIISKLEGEASFKFLHRLDQTPKRAREYNRDHVASYDRVLLELPESEARLVRWRPGFYDVHKNREDIFDAFGKPNVATEGDGLT